MLTSDFAILISSRSTKFCYARKHGEFLFSAEGDFISLCWNKAICKQFI